jgi:uncharacterized protein
MLYRQMGKTGEKVSALGYGCMRLPMKGRNVDEPRAARQIISAIDQGVNYVDTAQFYHNARGETIVGNALAQGYRNKIKLATKMHQMSVKSRKDMDNALDTQLKKLQTDHIDFYLMHGLMTLEGWQKLKQLGIEDFLEKSKKSGKIVHIGFSYHGDKLQFKPIVDDYPWEFCQIMYNFLDEDNQAGTEGLQYAASKGLGVAIMEPLRGGLLVKKMPPEIEAIWSRMPEKRTPAYWALRWVWNHPEVSVVLSGMNEESHIAENLKTAEDSQPNSLSSDQIEIMSEIKSIFRKKIRVGCTGCSYCMPCPTGVNIPLCFQLYNSKYFYNDKGFGTTTSQAAYLLFTSGADRNKPSYASLCKKCGKCEEKCPQSLPIREKLAEVAKDMQPFYFKPMAKVFAGIVKVNMFRSRPKNNPAHGH